MNNNILKAGFLILTVFALLSLAQGVANPKVISFTVTNDVGDSITFPAEGAFEPIELNASDTYCVTAVVENTGDSDVGVGKGRVFCHPWILPQYMSVASQPFSVPIRAGSNIMTEEFCGVVRSDAVEGTYNMYCAVWDYDSGGPTGTLYEHNSIKIGPNPDEINLKFLWNKLTYTPVDSIIGSTIDVDKFENFKAEIKIQNLGEGANEVVMKCNTGPNLALETIDDFAIPGNSDYIKEVTWLKENQRLDDSRASFCCYLYRKDTGGYISGVGYWPFMASGSKTTILIYSGLGFDKSDYLPGESGKFSVKIGNMGFEPYSGESIATVNIVQNGKTLATGTVPFGTELGVGRQTELEFPFTIPRDAAWMSDIDFCLDFDIKDLDGNSFDTVDLLGTNGVTPLNLNKDYCRTTTLSKPEAMECVMTSSYTANCSLANETDDYVIITVPDGFEEGKIDKIEYEPGARTTHIFSTDKKSVVFLYPDKDNLVSVFFSKVALNAPSGELSALIIAVILSVLVVFFYKPGKKN